MTVLVQKCEHDKDKTTDPGFLERGFICMCVCVGGGRFPDFI